MNNLEKIGQILKLFRGNHLAPRRSQGIQIPPRLLLQMEGIHSLHANNPILATLKKKTGMRMRTSLVLLATKGKYKEKREREKRTHRTPLLKTNVRFSNGG